MISFGKLYKYLNIISNTGNDWMPNYCLECGGNLNYDPVLKQFACKSCGATFTYQELLESKGTIHINEEDPKKITEAFFEFYHRKDEN